MKKMTVIVVLLLACTSLFARGTAESTGSSKPVAIQMSRPAITFDTTKDPVLLELGRRTGTQIDLLGGNRADYPAMLNTLAATDDLPDMITFNASQNPYLQWAADGLLMPLESYIQLSQIIGLYNSP